MHKDVTSGLDSGLLKELLDGSIRFGMCRYHGYSGRPGVLGLAGGSRRETEELG